MKKTFRNITIIAAVLFVICGAIVYLFWDMMFLYPSHSLRLDDPVASAATVTGDTYVLDQSGNRLVRINSEGKANLIVKGSDRTFLPGSRLTSDAKGNIYIQEGDILRGMQYESESITRMAPSGKFKKIASYDYSRLKKLQMRVVGMYPFGDGMHYLYKTAGSVLVCDENSDIIDTYALKNAEVFVSSAYCDEENGRLYYTSYDGKIVQLDRAGKTRIIYDAAEQGAESVPMSISGDDSGDLYVTDLGRRAVLRVDSSDGSFTEISDEAGIKERHIIYSVNADNKITATTASGIRFISGDSLTAAEAFPLAFWLRLHIIILWLCFFYMILFVLAVLAYFFLGLVKRAARSMKIIITVVAGVTAISIMILGTLIPRFKTLIPEKVYQRANLAAAITADFVDVDALSRLDSVDDFYSEDYLKVKSSVGRVFEADANDVGDLYCNIYRVFDGTITKVFSLDDTAAFYPCDIEYEGSDEQRVITDIAGNRRQIGDNNTEDIRVLSPVSDIDGNKIALVEVGTEMKAVMDEVRRITIEIVINVIAIMTVGVILILQLVFFLEGRSMMRVSETSSYLPPEVMRIVPFIMSMLVNMPVAFLPIYAMRISVGGANFGLSPGVLAAIPISAEVISNAVLSACGGRFIRILGQKRGLLISAFMLTGGLALRIIPNIWVLTLGSLLCGAGAGVIVLAVNMMIADMPEDKKTIGFAYYSSSVMSGYISGVIFGGFIIQWVSYTWVFAFTAVLSLVVIRLCRVYLGEYDINMANEDTKEKRGISTIRFLLRPEILLYLVMIVVPIMIGEYFVSYMFPIMADDFGISETNIGYLILVNGLVMMLFTKTTSNMFFKPSRQRLGLFLSSVLYAGSFSLVAFFRSVPALIGALIIMGLADSFGMPLQNIFFTEQESTGKYGYDRALGVYNVFRNVAKSAGSFVFSYILLVGVRQGLNLLAVITVAMAAIFLLFGRTPKEVSHEE